MTERHEMRVSDRERQAIVDRLRHAMDEGRLDLGEYDSRMAAAYAAVTYGDLDPLVADLPAEQLPPSPGLAPGSPAAQAWRTASGTGRAPAVPTPSGVLSPGVVADMHLSLKVLWTVWAAVVSINLTVWLLVSISSGGPVYFWPMWFAVPGVLLAGSTVGVHELRARQRARPPAARPDGRTALDGG